MWTLLLWACASEPAPVGEVTGRTYTAAQLGARITFPEGWQLALGPKHFRAGLPGTLLEARHGELVAVLTFHAVPSVLERASALDLLPIFHPTGTPERFERLPDCDGAMLRQVGEWTHVAQRTRTGLIEWQAFGAEPDALIALVCEHTEVE